MSLHSLNSGMVWYGMVYEVAHTTYRNDGAGTVYNNERNLLPRLTGRGSLY